MCLFLCFLCAPKTFASHDISTSIIDLLNSKMLSNINPIFSLSGWSSYVNTYKNPILGKSITLKVVNALKANKISVMYRSGYWTDYMVKHISYHIYRRLVYYYDPDHNNEFTYTPMKKVFIMLDLPEIEKEELDQFRERFVKMTDNTSIEMSTIDESEKIVLDTKLTNILDEIIETCDFVNMIGIIDREFTNQEAASKLKTESLLNSKI